MSCIIFSHGFAFDKDFWIQLASKFCNHKIIIFDYGYFYNSGSFIFEDGLLSQTNNDTMNKLISSSANIYGVGHSLGFAKLFFNPIARYTKFNKIISLAGFAKFNNSNTTSQNITRMADLCRKKKNFLPSFYKICKINYALRYNDINYDLLTQDLDLLYKIDISDKIRQYDRNILHLFDVEDMILDTKNLSNSIKSISVPNSGHGIGFNNVDVCYKAILDFISQ
jgi:hypothetical protein